MTLPTESHALATHPFWPTLRRFSRAARRVYPQPGWRQRFVDYGIFVARSLRHYRTADDWYAQLDGPLRAVAMANPSLYRKIIRPYLVPGLSDTRKLAILEEHYRFLLSHVAFTALPDICADSGRVLLAVAGRHGEAYELRWLSDSKFRKEGEHSLGLYCATHRVLVSTIAFVMMTGADGRRTLTIGAAQGLPPGEDKRIIVEVTKALHGLRPRALLLFALQVMAQQWHLNGVRAVGNDRHISTDRVYTFNRARRPTLSYDEFWRENAGVRADDGFFDFPNVHVPRDLPSIQSHKRSQYRQRYAMLDTLRTALETALVQLQ